EPSRTLSQSASSSSATMRARAVPTCWPISARMIETVTMPLRSMRYQIVGSNSAAGEVEAASAAVKPRRGKPNRTLVPAAPIRKLRRDTGFCFITGPASTLSMCASHFGRSQFDRPADADIGHASAQIAAHDGVDVLVARVGKILEQRCGLHDLSGLAIPALRCLRLNPGLLQRMLTVRVEPLDRRDRRVRHRAERRDAGADRASINVHSACAAHADATAEFRALESDLIADDPQERCVLGDVDRNGPVIEFEGGHDYTAAKRSVIVTPLVPCELPPLGSQCSSRLEVLCACAADMQPTVQCRGR